MVLEGARRGERGDVVGDVGRGARRVQGRGVGEDEVVVLEVCGRAALGLFVEDGDTGDGGQGERMARQVPEEVVDGLEDGGVALVAGRLELVAEDAGEEDALGVLDGDVGLVQEPGAVRDAAGLTLGQGCGRLCQIEATQKLMVRECCTYGRCPYPGAVASRSSGTRS